jgi:hypothetical protein
MAVAVSRHGGSAANRTLLEKLAAPLTSCHGPTGPSTDPLAYYLKSL